MAIDCGHGIWVVIYGVFSTKIPNLEGRQREKKRKKLAAGRMVGRW